MKSNGRFYWLFALNIFWIFSANVHVTQSQTMQGDGRIAFASNADGDFEIYVIDANGTNLQQITVNDVEDTSPKWSPDGTQIAYVQSGELHIMDVEGSNDVTVADISNVDNFDWSPSGDSWVVESLGDIFVINRVTISITNITDTLDTIESNPVWSEANKIAFLSTGNNFVPLAVDGEPVKDIYTMNPDGSDLAMLGPGRSSTDNLSWLGTNSLMYSQSYLSNETNITHRGIFFLNIMNSSEALVSSESTSVGSFGIASSGTKIVYVVGGQLATMNIDGTSDQVITNLPGGKLDPDWQPIPGQQQNLAVTDFTLINTDTDIAPLTDGDTLNLPSLPSNLALKTTVSGAAGSIAFNLDGVETTDNEAPFTVPLDSTLGARTLTATPYSGPDGTGDAGTPLTVNFTVVDSSR